MSDVPPMFRVAPPRASIRYGSRLMHYVVDRVETPTPYLGLRAQLLQLIFNPLSLFWVGLAIGVAIFGKCLVAAVLVTSRFEKQLCEASSGYNSVSLAADSVQIHAMASMNSHLWNMEVTSEAFVQSVSDTLNVSLTSSRESARNATDQMANWTDKNLRSSKNATTKMINTLNNVEEALEKSGLYNINASNFSAVFDWNIPTDISQHLQHNENFKNELNTASINGNISKMIDKARQELMDILVVGTRPNGNATCSQTSYDSVSHKLKAPYIGAIIPFSLFAVICIPFMGWIRYLQWQRALDSVRELETHPDQDTLEVVFQVSESSLVTLANWLSSWTKEKYQVYVRWIISFALSASLSRVLAITIFLCIFSIANAPLLSQASSLPKQQDTSWQSDINSTYTYASQRLNSQCQTVFTKLISNMTSTHNSLLKHAGSLSNTTLTLTGPFGRGIALEQIRLPSTVSNYSNKGNSDLLQLMASLNNTCWLTAVALFCIWCALVLAAAVYAYFSSKKIHRVTRLNEKQYSIEEPIKCSQSCH